MGEVGATPEPIDPERLRAIPRMDAMLADERIRAHSGRLGGARVKAVLTASADEARAGRIAPGEVLERALATLASQAGASTMTAVLNATGVIVHTNLGRAPLSAAAQEAIQHAAGYVDVELDLGSGQRAGRGRGARDALLAAVPAAGAALVVNNNAAAVALAVAALAGGRELVISRGELIEIGDGFRLPDLIEAAGVRLREIGTTNKTHAADYRAAVGPQTGALIKIHPSNYRVEGFTASVSIAECAAIAHEHGLPLIADIGSGLLAPDPLLPDEPDAESALRDGADVVLASGDKLLGGPQAGIILGRAEVVERLRRHPLARAFRSDKITLAALEATVRGPRPPVLEALHADPSRLRARAEAWRDSLAGLIPDTEVVEVTGAVGGGGAPGVPLPGWALALPTHFALALRTADRPVLARVESGRTLLDPRCIPEAADPEIVRTLRTLVESAIHTRRECDSYPSRVQSGTAPGARGTSRA